MAQDEVAVEPGEVVEHPEGVPGAFAEEVVHAEIGGDVSHGVGDEERCEPDAEVNALLLRSRLLDPRREERHVEV